MTKEEPTTIKPGPVWLVVGFVLSMLLWAWVLYDGKLLLQDTSLGTITAVEFSAIVSLPAFGFAIFGRRLWPVVLFFLASACVAGFCATPWHPRKRFLNDFFALSDSNLPVPTVSQVRERMSKYTETPCTTPKSSTEYPLCYRWDTTNPRYSTDVGEVWIADGKVSRLDFLGR